MTHINKQEHNIQTAHVVPSSVSLEDKETYCVTSTGVLTAATGAFVYGVVRIGRPANEASQVITYGETVARVNGSGVNLASGDPITGGADGKFVKCAWADSSYPRGHVLEAVTTDTTARVMLF